MQHIASTAMIIYKTASLICKKVTRKMKKRSKSWDKNIEEKKWSSMSWIKKRRQDLKFKSHH